MTSYQDSIRESLARRGRTDIDPRHVEGWMRCEYGTLDALTRQQFSREIGLAIACIDASDVNEAGQNVSEALAVSYGL
jgi:hypothetical protein